MKYRENHYVPVWYLERFLPTEGERKFRYLDLTPDHFRDPRGILRTMTALHRWGPYHVSRNRTSTPSNMAGMNPGKSNSSFGKVDEEGREAVEFFSRYRGSMIFKAA